MSGREQDLCGFKRSDVTEFYSVSSPEYPYLTFNTRLLNRFIHIASQFRIDRIEVFNALGLFDCFLRSNENCMRFPCAVLFFALIRLSVFWRRRRDILAQNNPFVLRYIELLSVPSSVICEAECDILANVGCHVWDAQLNLAEVVYCVMDRFKTPENHDVVKNVAIDVCFIILSCDVRNFAGNSTSVWYDAPCMLIYIQSGKQDWQRLL